MKLVATTVVMFVVMMSMQAHHEAEGRVIAVMNMKEQALLLGSSLKTLSGGQPSPNPATEINNINARGFTGHKAAHAPPPPRPTAHSNTMQLLFSMAATTVARR